MESLKRCIHPAKKNDVLTAKVVFVSVKLIFFKLKTEHEYFHPNAVIKQPFIFWVEVDFSQTFAQWTNKSTNYSVCEERPSPAATTAADMLVICVSKHQALFDQQDTDLTVQTVPPLA